MALRSLLPPLISSPAIDRAKRRRRGLPLETVEIIGERRRDGSSLKFLSRDYRFASAIVYLRLGSFPVDAPSLFEIDTTRFTRISLRREQRLNEGSIDSFRSVSKSEIGSGSVEIDFEIVSRNRSFARISLRGWFAVGKRAARGSDFARPCSPPSAAYGPTKLFVSPLAS